MHFMILVLLAAVTVTAQTQEFQPVATVRELMERIIIPTSDDVFAAGAEAPVTDDEWTALENSSLTLAESGNLLLMRTPQGDNRVWMRESKALIEAGRAAYRAAKDRKAEALLEAGDKILETCSGCHDQYLTAK
jgi:hypothetical protein